MTFVRNYVITGGRNSTPASLSTTLEPVSLDSDVGVAMRSISYGERYNLTEPDNQIKISIDRELVLTRDDGSGRAKRLAKEWLYKVVDLYEGDPVDYGDGADRSWKVTLGLAEKYYRKIEDIVITIVNSINRFLEQHGFEIRCELVNKATYSNMYINIPPGLTIMRDAHVFNFLDANFREDSIIFAKGLVPNKTEMCFVYLNILKQSYINRHKSRLLAIFPMESVSGGGFYEFKNTAYVPIEVRQFSAIKIDLRNMRGEHVKLNNNRDSVISLHMRKMESYK